VNFPIANKLAVKHAVTSSEMCELKMKKKSLRMFAQTVYIMYSYREEENQRKGLVKLSYGRTIQHAVSIPL